MHAGDRASQAGGARGSAVVFRPGRADNRPGPVRDAATRVIRWLVVPLLVGGATIATYVALARGAGAAATLAVCGAVTVLVVALLERRLAYARAWRQRRGDVITDLLHFVISGLLAEALPGLVPAGSGLWPAAWPLPAQLGLALVVAEFLQYWLHRLLHEWRPLWRLHAVHHSALRLYWLNNTRAHPIEALLNGAATLAPLVALGAGPQVLALYAAFAGTFALLQHANVDVRLGPLNWIFSAAEVHRWHHSRRREEADANYGAVLLLWDLVFGTRRVPTDRPPSVDVGLGDMPEFPTGYLAQVASPLSARLWRRGAPTIAAPPRTPSQLRQG